MSTLTTPQQPAPVSPLRGLVARYPVAAFLIMLYPITLGFTLLPLLIDLPALPFNLPLDGPLNHIFGVMLPAFVVLWAMRGAPGVRDLASRSVRWRVHPLWYALVLLGLPVAVILAVTAIFGSATLNGLLNQWPLLFSTVLPLLLLRFVFFNLPEEIGWMGFMQAELQRRHGPLKAALFVELPFLLFHVPGFLVDGMISPADLPLALLVLGVFGISQLFGRVVMMWLYNKTNHSLLLVGLFHAVFNVTVNAGFSPGAPETGFLITVAVMGLAAILLVVFTRGRLGYAPETSTEEQFEQTKEELPDAL